MSKRHQRLKRKRYNFDRKHHKHLRVIYQEIKRFVSWRDEHFLFLRRAKA